MADKGEIKLVLLGSGSVGKSAITIRFITGNFVETYDPTIEDAYRKELEVDGSTHTLDILDTAGQEEFHSMRGEYIRDGQGFILVFDLMDKATLDEIESIYEEIDQHKEEEEAPILLVGNKCDVPEDEWQVKQEDVDRVLEHLPCSKFMRTSAKSSINIEEAFKEIVRMVLDPPVDDDGDAEDKDGEDENKADNKKEKNNSKQDKDDESNTRRCHCTLM
eukprot:gb/GECH01012206.1/.p1 GENE.gb/GECH01012206.1/~~gb/GECH01012206.1/.p1  ORF type:complete len:219 (+),score=52.09 gb/GECH01012206.1/:1-657(+)